MVKSCKIVIRYGNAFTYERHVWHIRVCMHLQKGCTHINGIKWNIKIYIKLKTVKRLLKYFIEM